MNIVKVSGQASPKELKAEYDKEYREKNKDKLKVKAAKDFIKMTLEQRLYRAAKHRASANGYPFDITVADISVPDRCPVLDIPLIQGKGKFTKNSPTLDKLIPKLGYVKGNINVISRLANVIKQDVDGATILKVAEWTLRRTNDIK